MSGTFMNKIYGLFGGKNEDDYFNEDENSSTQEYYYDDDDENENENENENRGLFGSRKNKILNINQTQQIKMIISKPTSFEQTEDICECLKQKKAVIVNLEYVNKDIARRIVDFMSGAVQALDGHIEKVSNSIFLFAPLNYDIANEATKEEIRNKLSVSWLKNG